MKILGVIPARSGSKGIPGKNVRVLGGKPLIAHTIQAAALSYIDRIVVSTDSEDIASVARQFGVRVPWLRPHQLATDEASVVDVVLHALERLELDDGFCPDAVMLLQPTSPFRSVNTIRRALDLYQEASYESVIAVSPVRDHPYWCKRINSDGILENFIPRSTPPHRRQELPAVYRLNGAIYLASVKTVRNSRSFYSPHPRALVIPEEEDIDIDTPLDFEIAQALSVYQKI